MKKAVVDQHGTKKRAFLWAEGLVCCLGLIFLMSHNAAAFQITESVQNRVSISAPYWKYRSNSTWSANRNTSISRTPNDATITGINLSSSSSSSVKVYQGEYIVMHGWITFNELPHGSEYFNISGYLGISAASESKNCSIINWDALYQEYWATQGIERYNFDVTCRVLTDTNSPVLNFYTRSNVAGVSGTDTVMSMNITGWDVYEHSDETSKEENTANENIEQNEQDSSSSGSDAENASQSLISAIGGFVSSITSASPSNCNIDGDMGKFDLGNIDLCANPVPTYIQVISSFILIGLCIPFAIIMFNRFIALFRSFQS